MGAMFVGSAVEGIFVGCQGTDTIVTALCTKKCALSFSSYESEVCRLSTLNADSKALHSIGQIATDRKTKSHNP